MVPCMSFARSSLSCHAFGPLWGAGFAAGSLLKFDETHFLILLNYLAQEASGLTTWRLDEAHTLKSYVFAGMPASNGVKCAMLVHAGWTGAGDVLGTDRNFFDAISPTHKLALNVDGLGTEFKIMETDLKKYSVGFPIAAPLAALESILDKTNAKPDQVEKIVIRYDPDWYKVIGDKNKMPDLSLRHCLAATVVEGHLSFHASHDEALMLDREILAVGQRIEFLDAPPGQDRFEAVVEVTIDGEVHSARQSRDVLGRIQNPMTREQSDSKVLELLCTVMSAQDAQGVVDLVNVMEKEKDLSRLLGVLCSTQ